MRNSYVTQVLSSSTENLELTPSPLLEQIEDSDDDEEADARFFAAEAALRDKLAAGAVSVHLDNGTKKRKGKAKASKAAAGDNSDSSDVEPSESGKKRKSKAPPKKSKKKDAATNARGRKQPKKTSFDADEVSDLEDDGDDAMLDKLRRAKDKTGSAENEEDQPATSSPSTSTSTSRKRAASITSASSAAAPGVDGGLSEDEEEEVGVSQAKKRRVIVDSDEE